MKKITVGFVSLGIIVLLTGCSTNQVNGSTNSISEKVTSTTSENSNTHSLSVKIMSEKYPKWLVNDIKIASQVHFPVLVQNYLFNWNNQRSDEWNFNTIEVGIETHRLWIGGYIGTSSQRNYGFYYGPFDIKGFYDQVVHGATFRPGQVSTVYMFESGINAFMPAISLDLGNGSFMAFAPNQVITKNEHAGVDQYALYPVKGIKIPVKLPNALQHWPQWP